MSSKWKKPKNIKELKKQVRMMQRVEKLWSNTQPVLKYSDRHGQLWDVLYGSTPLLYSPFGFTTPYTSWSLLSITPGTGENDRIGNRIFCKDLRIQGTIERQARQFTSSAAYNSSIEGIVNMCVVLDKQWAAELPYPTLDQVYTNVSGVTLGEMTPERNMSNSERFRVLYFKSYNFEDLACRAIDWNVEAPETEEIDLPAQRVQFDTGRLRINQTIRFEFPSPSAEPPIKGSPNVWFYMWASTAGFKFIHNTRMRFYDN